MPVKNTKSSIVLRDEMITSKIYVVRGLKVMIDRDLAEMYGVETKRLKESVKRNRKKFPDDFMFILNKEELESLRTQFATSKEKRGGTQYLPFVFTEQGVGMLSTVLKRYSDTGKHSNYTNFCQDERSLVCA